MNASPACALRESALRKNAQRRIRLRPEARKPGLRQAVVRPEARRPGGPWRRAERSSVAGR
jgi:hypothetical protein